MSNSIAHPFAYLESALEFIILLQGQVVEASDEARGALNGVSTATESEELRLALLRLHQLSFSLKSAREILNDLTRLQASVRTDAATWRHSQLGPARHGTPLSTD